MSKAISLSPSPPPSGAASSQASSSRQPAGAAIPVVTGSGARVPTQFLDNTGGFSSDRKLAGSSHSNGHASSSNGYKTEQKQNGVTYSKSETVDLTGDDTEDFSISQARGPGILADPNERVCIGLVNAVVLTMMGLPATLVSLAPPKPGDYNSHPKWAPSEWPKGYEYYLEPGYRPVELMMRQDAGIDKAEVLVHEVIAPMDVRQQLAGKGVPIPKGPQLNSIAFGTLAEKYNRGLFPLMARNMIKISARCRIVTPNSGQNFLHAIELLCFATRRDAERVSNFLMCENVHLEYPHNYTPRHFANSPPLQLTARNQPTNASPHSRFVIQSNGSVMHTKEATEQEKKRQVDAVYASLRDGEDLEMMEESSLIATPLLPHQKQALAFLMDREKKRSFAQAGKNEIVSLWKAKKHRDQIVSYENVVTQGEKKKEPAICRGAILADDMGLGKTLVTIALIASTTEEARVFEERRDEEENGHASTSAQNGNGRSSSVTIQSGDDDSDDEVTIEDFSINVHGAPPVKKPKTSARQKKKGKRELAKESLAASRESEIVTRSRATLVVLPLTLVSAWESQIDEHWGTKGRPSVYIYHGSGRLTDAMEIAQYDIVMTTYATLATEYAHSVAEDEDGSDGANTDGLQSRGDEDDIALVDTSGHSFGDEQEDSRKKKKGGKKRKAQEERPLSPLQQIEWFRIVLDEAHTIKEARTLQARAVCNLLGSRRLCLTGTPVQNRIDDLFSLIRYLRLEPFDDRGVWNQFCGSKEKAASLRSARKANNDKNAEPLDKMALARVQTIMKFLTLRRTKETKHANGEMILSLPAKYSRILTLKFDDRERGTYDEMRIRYKDDFEQMKASDTLKHNYATILHEISNLRMTCDHMGLVDASKDAKRRKELGDLDTDPATAIMRDGMSRDRAITLFEVLSSSDRARCRLCEHDLASFGDEGGPVPEGVIKAPVLTKCLHLFCSDCMRSHVGTQRYDKPRPDDRFACPECNETISPLLEMRELLAADIEQEVGAKALGQETFGCDRHLDLKRRPDYSSKIGALIGELEAFSRCNPSSLLYDRDAPVLDQVSAREGEELAEPVLLVSSSDPLFRPRPIKSVVFSQWTKMLDRVARAVHRSGIKAAYLDGRMRRQERSDNLDRFKNDDSVEVLLVSLKAGGIGLNLVSACRAYLMEPYWNPAIENQGLDRVHRMGQTRPVITTKFIMGNSIEENMLELQRRKLKLAESVGEKRSAERQREELNLLFSAREEGEEGEAEGSGSNNHT